MNDRIFSFSKNLRSLHHSVFPLVRLAFLMAVLSFIFLPKTHAQVGWSLVYNSTDNENKIALVGTDTIFAVSDNAELLHFSYDGGNTWQTRPMLTSLGHWFSDICFPSSTVGYASGGSAFGTFSNFLFKTTDAGDTWNMIAGSQTSQNPQYYTISNAQFITDDIGLISYEYDGMFRTTDGGATFTQVFTSIPPYTISDIVFASSTTCYMSLHRHYQSSSNHIYEIYKSTDQGLNWAPIYTDTVLGVNIGNLARVLEMDFVDEQNGFAVGENNRFMKTTDGGVTWQKPVLATQNAHIYSVDFLDPQVGYVTLDSGIYKTTDGGVTFSQQPTSPFADIIFQVRMADADHGYLIGRDGYNSIYKLDAANAVEPSALEGTQVYPNPANDHLQVQLPSDVRLESLSLRNVLGQELKSLEGDIPKMNLENVPAGIYFLQIGTNSGDMVRRVLVE